MIFGVNDETQFYAAREQLTRQFADWIQKNHIGTENADKSAVQESAAQTAALALDWKWGYDDGDLSLWTLSHLDELLLRWIPRKVMMPAEEAGKIPLHLNLFVSFLASSGLLSPKSSSITTIASHLRQIVAPFQRALGDRSRHGMGKSLFSGLEQMGMSFNPDDPSSVADLMASFNSLSFEERGAILGLEDFDPDNYDPNSYDPNSYDPNSYDPNIHGDPFGGIPIHLQRWVELITGLDLPPALILPKARREELASKTSIATLFADIGSFFDRPRKLTKIGNLTVADGKTLAEILQSDGDVRDPARKIQSSMDLPGLSFRLDWARQCGVIKMVKGTMSSTASFKKRTETQHHEQAFNHLLKEGPLAYGGRSRWRMSAIEDIIDAGVPALLAILFALDGAPIPHTTLLETTREITRECVQRGPYLTDEQLDRLTSHSFNELWQLFEIVGVVECVDFARDDNDDPFDLPFGDVLDELEGIVVSAITLKDTVPATIGLRLSELGRAVVPPYLASLGMEVPKVGLFSHAPLTEVIANVSQWHRKRIEGEFVAWVNANGADQAIVELTQIAMGADDIQTRVAIVELAGSLEERSESAVRGLLSTKAGGHAEAWLLTHDFLEPNDENMGRARLSSFELLSLHCTGDPDDDTEVLKILLPVLSTIEPTEFFNLLWRVSEPWAGDVLATVGRLHPDKAIAKQARKAVMQHHTHLANLRHR